MHALGVCVQGINVRQRARELASLLSSNQRIQEEREKVRCSSTHHQHHDKHSSTHHRYDKHSPTLHHHHHEKH